MPSLPDMNFKLSANDRAAREALQRTRNEVHKLGEASELAGQKTHRFSRRMSVATGGSRRMQMGVQNAAFQFQDLAVQIGGGTDAMRALGQQLPQLLGGFGVAGAVIGALVAVAIPLRTAMQGLSADGRDMTEVFGTLSPLAESISQAFSGMASSLHSFAELAINNIDRMIIIAGTAASIFATKWVAGFVAARIATISLSGATLFLRGAIIRTGIGALVVGAGELFYQFTRLAKAAGGFGQAVTLLKDVVAETFSRIGKRIIILKTNFQLMVNDIQYWCVLTMGKLAEGWGAFLDAFARAYNNTIGAVMSGATMATNNKSIAQMDTSRNMGLVTDAMVGILDEESKAQADLDKPYESVKRIKDLLTSMKDDKVTLPDILGAGSGDTSGGSGGGGGGKSPVAKAVEEQLSAIEKLVQSTKAGLSEATGAWGSYFDDLVQRSGSSSQRLLGIAKSFGAAQALIDAWQAHNKVLADPALPWWARIASAAKVLASGLGAVNAIKSVSAGGGAGGAAGGGGAASAAAAAPATPLEATLNLQGPLANLIGGEIGTLLDRLNDEAGDRGYRLMVAPT